MTNAPAAPAMPEGTSHVVVHLPAGQDEPPQVIASAASNHDAQIVASTLDEQGAYPGELRVMTVADAADTLDLIPGADPNAAAELRAKIEKQRELVNPDPDDDQDDDGDNGDDEAAAPPPDPDGRALFDDSIYEREELAIPKVDGQQIDRIAIKVTGEVMLNRSDAADVALYNRLQFGRSIELWVEGRVNGTGAKGVINRDGDLDVIVGTKAVKVDSVRVVQPEELTSLVSTEAFKLTAERALAAGVDPARLGEILHAVADRQAAGG